MPHACFGQVDPPVLRTSLLTSVEMLELGTSVQYVKGIGPHRAAILANKGIHTVDDLLHYLPFRLRRQTESSNGGRARPGEMATVIARVRNSGIFRTSRMPIFQLTVGQGRAKLKCLWFNVTYLRDRFQPGQLVALYGKVDTDRRGELQIVQPQFEILGDASEDGEADDSKAAMSLEVGRIVPIYESAGQGKLTARWFRRIIRSTLESLTPDLPDSIPPQFERVSGLISPTESLWKVHWPDAGKALQICNRRARPRMSGSFLRSCSFWSLDSNYAGDSRSRKPELRSSSTTAYARQSRKSCHFIPPPHRNAC